MSLKGLKITVCMVMAAVVISVSTIPTNAATLPAAGLGLTLDEGTYVKEVKDQVASSATEGTETTDVNTANTKTKSVAVDTEDVEIVEPVALVTTEQKEAEAFLSLVIADVNDYVNIRSEADENSEIVGKLYDNSVGTFIQEVDGWYEIQSGECTGFVKAGYCITGESAVTLAQEIGVRIATVNTEVLRVREEPNTNSTVLGTVGFDDDLRVISEDMGWVLVEIEEGNGYIAAEFVDLSTEFIEAESKEQEEARLAQEEADRLAAQAAAAAAIATAPVTTTTNTASTTVASGSGQGTNVANYALQFVGNPYVYGGSSLTNGTDCSGFVMSVYANFGISLPHSSSADRTVGYDVGGLANAQPGDIVCYSGHVAIYIGNGQIVHASTSSTGIIVSNASYRTPLAVRRIF